nr:HAMP domain-containing methyl-accepting chemotaxis protein [Bradyrhizobium sp. cir1]
MSMRSRTSSLVVAPTLRLRTRIMLGFSVVLAISATSMGFAYYSFERVSLGVGAYRHSVQEADLARNIDRELISYRLLAQYFVVTGREIDGKAALAAEANLRKAIDSSMNGTTSALRLDQITTLTRDFAAFSNIFADILRVRAESSMTAQGPLTRSATSLRYKLDDLSSETADSGPQDVTAGAKRVLEQFQAAAALVNTFVFNSDKAVAANAITRLNFVGTSLLAISPQDPQVGQKIKEISTLLDEYRSSLTKLVDNSRSIDQLIIDMAKSASAIGQGSDTMKSDLLADQKRLEAESDTTVGATEHLLVLLAAGGFLLGGALAMLLGRGLSRPMITMCKAMRELSSGNFDIVLPGLGRNDELGEMASAMEEFKKQAIAKGEREAAARDAQNEAGRATRRAELIRFADNFETAVGAIVTSVSDLALQLESAAGTLTRTAESTQRLSGDVAGASEHASSNMQSVACATEELSASVNEIGRQVRASSQIAEEAVLQAQQTDVRIGKLSSAAQRIGDVVRLITAIAEQTNLLALNATIEAARAGEAGRGFAVVASEVKSLASQTAKATDEISSHISGMQDATRDSVAAIKEIGGTISQISSIASTIAIAVDQQSSTTQEIAKSLQVVAHGTHEAVSNVMLVNRGATETGCASEAVLSSAKTLSSESSRLREELDRFMANIRAA